MQLEITGLQIDTSDAFRTFVHEKIESLATKLDVSVVRAAVVVAKDAHLGKEKSLFRCDVTVHFGQNLDVWGHGVGQDARICVVQALHHLEYRMVRQKKRLISEKRHQEGIKSLAAQQFIMSPIPYEEEVMGVEDEGDAPATIAEMPAQILELTPSQAALRLELAQEKALMFRNKSSGQYNMVYQRNDGNIGWVIPPVEKAS